MTLELGMKIPGFEYCKDVFTTESMERVRTNNGLYHFGPFCLDAQERVLLREGRLVPLPSKALSTLLVLVRNGNHLVEKEEMMKEVWPDEFVEEGNLAQHIFMLRKALRDTTDGPKYIETIPRRGYRFLHTIQQAQCLTNGSTFGPQHDGRDPLVRQKFQRPNARDEQERRIIKRHTENADAYLSYVKGRYFWSRHTTVGLQEAIRWFRNAIEIDPGFALGYAGVIDCYLRLTTNYLPPVIDSIALKCREFDDAFFESPTFDIRCEWDWKSADRECNRAAELKTNYPAAHQWLVAYMFARRLFTGVAGIDGSSEQAQGACLVTTLNSKLLDQIQLSHPTLDEEVQVFCVVAREQIDAGNYEAARMVLQRWWTLGRWPQLDSLAPHSSGDLLFTVGSLAGNLASTLQLRNGQKHAQALLNGSIALFEQLNAKRCSVEGRIELALCYKREGLFDLARDTLLTALNYLPPDDFELKSVALIRLASLEREAAHYDVALQTLNKVAEMIGCVGPWATGRYHLELASTLRELATNEQGKHYFEQAIQDFAEAIYQSEAMGNHRLAAIVENNRGYLLLSQKRLDEAEEHLIRARSLFERLGDRVRCAQVDETMAQLHLAAQEFDLAEQMITRSIETLKMGEQDSLLAESLRTQGIVLCKLGRYSEAQRILDRAQVLSEHYGDTDGSGRARQIKTDVIRQLRQRRKLKRSRRAVRIEEAGDTRKQRRLHGS